MSLMVGLPRIRLSDFFEQNDDKFDKVYKCIELDKDKNEILVKPSGGEIQKMRIGMFIPSSFNRY